MVQTVAGLNSRLDDKVQSMAEPNRSELYAVQEPPLASVNGSNGHHPAAASGVEETFVFPASREQTRYWMLAQLDPSSTASNMAISFDIEGSLNDKAAEAAIAALDHAA